MKVFKFGGAAIQNIDGIKNVENILRVYQNEPLLVVVSAMGKTTNALEKVVTAFNNGQKDEALLLFEHIKQQHLTTAKYLLVTEYLACESKLQEFFTEVEWLLYDRPVQSYDYYYDQIVCVGELLSTCIVSHYLKETGIANTWKDVRDIIRTDQNFRDANIDWNFTTQKTIEIIRPLLQNEKLVITQGFIGATDENESTTLGREGSDYTAALFANILDADSLTIWKDVESVMNADPREIADVKPLPELSYMEVIEMAYYGAQVIHPKTIKPLQNKNIPLYVKCFLNPALEGTIIHNKNIKNLPPIIVIKKEQVMMSFQSKDFSFIGEQSTGILYDIFKTLSVKPSLMQNGAINMLCAFDNRENKISAIAVKASEYFDVALTPGLILLTIRHYTPAEIAKYVDGKPVYIRQQTPDTISLLYRE